MAVALVGKHLKALNHTCETSPGQKSHARGSRCKLVLAAHKRQCGGAGSLPWLSPASLAHGAREMQRGD